MCLSTPLSRAKGQTCHKIHASTGSLTPGSSTPGVSATPRALDHQELLIIEGSKTKTARQLNHLHGFLRICGARPRSPPLSLHDGHDNNQVHELHLWKNSFRTVWATTASLHKGHDNNQVHELCLGRQGHVSLKNGHVNNLVQELQLWASTQSSALFWARASVAAQQRARQPWPRNATAGPPQFSADNPMTHNNGHVDNLSESCTCEISTKTAQCALSVPVSAYNWSAEHSVRELDLGCLSQGRPRQLPFLLLFLLPSRSVFPGLGPTTPGLLVSGAH